MEDEKLAAYYDELSRKGEGAAKFKRGLGFSSSSSSDSLSKPSSSSSSPFLSNFVRASSPASANPSSDHPDKKVQIESIHNKLNKDHHRLPPSRADGDRRSHRRDHRSRSRSPSSRRRSRSPGRSGRRDSDLRRGERSSRDRRSGGGGGGVDYSKLIEGYSQMTPAERVKAKMKHQLSRTAEKDTAKGMGAGWERFDFNKDAPLDDEEIEVAEDDALLVKNMGHSFRFSALETKREEDVKAAHDQAMFGGSTALSGNSEKESIHEDVTQEEDAQPGKTLVSDKVLSIQQGSWRDRVRRLHDGSKV